MNLRLFLLSFCAVFSAFSQDYLFIPNQDQWNNNVRYKATVPGGHIFLENNTITYQFLDYSEVIERHTHPTNKSKKSPTIKQHVVKARFIGANSLANTAHTGKSKSYFNYFLGNDPNRWASKVYAYNEVLYKDLYVGINLKFRTESYDLKYDLIVAPYTDPSIIKIEYEGADRLYIKKGELNIETTLGKVTEKKPFVYQIINGKVKSVYCEYKLDGNVLSFSFPNGFEPSAELVIDPTLIFSSYSGSTANNFGMTATYDDFGNFYAGGMAFNTGYPTTTGVYDSTSNPNGTVSSITDVVITKYASDGISLLYSTYLGGGTISAGTETVHSLIVNSNDELCLYGVTSSADFPTTASAYSNTFAGGNTVTFVNNGTSFSTGTDIYISKFSSDGSSLLASTLIGGSANDGMNYTNSQTQDSLFRNYGDQFRGEIMIDDLDNIYVATCTKSADFPIINGFGTTLSGGQAGVVMKFDQNLSTLIWSTFLNGNQKDAAYGLKVTHDYEVYVTGGTSSSTFPVTTGAYQTIYGGGKADAFVTRISANGGSIIYSTFLGTNVYDQAYFIELDRFGQTHIVGQTLGTSTFPVTPGVYQNANSCQFITSFDSTLSNIYYSTIYGNGNGSVNISPSAFLVDHCGNIYVSGWGADILQNNQLTNMPVTSNAFQSGSGDGFNFHLIVLEREATSLLYGTYFGGSLSREHVDGGTSRFDKDGIVYQSVCAGCQNNDDFPTTTGAWSATNNSTGCNNGVFKFDFEILPVASFTVDNVDGCVPLTVNFTNSSINNTNYFWDFGNGDTTSTNPNPIRVYNDTGTYYVYLAIEDSICALVDTAVQIITVHPELFLDTFQDTVICDSATFDIWASGIGHDGNYIWSSGNQFTDTLNINLNDSVLTVSPTLPTWYYVSISNPTCRLIDSVFVDFTSNSLVLNNVQMCAGDDALITVTGGSAADPFISFDWSADSIIVSGDGTNSITINPLSSQFVYLTAISQNGCIVFDSAYVDVSQPPLLINAWADVDTIAYGSSTGVHVTPTGYSYQWIPTLVVESAGSANTIATPLEIGDNILIVQITNGACLRSDTINIFTFEVVCGQPDIFVPNAFTPNLDNNNDVLYVRANNLTEIYFTVYDRWGELMFETSNLSNGWDGKFNGKEVDPDVYVYYLEGLCIGGSQYFQKGNVTLIR